MKTSVADTKLALSYFGALEGDLYDAFMKGARNPAINENYSFFHTTDTACASDFGTEGTSIALIAPALGRVPAGLLGPARLPVGNTAPLAPLGPHVDVVPQLDHEVRRVLRHQVLEE